MQFKQISFTRINGVGWAVVNESPDLPKSASEFFSSVQNGNTKSPQFDVEDSEKRITVELTVNEESNSVFFTRIKSETDVDEAGRPIMFANSFVAPLDEFVRDPLSVLNIDESNYRFTVEQTKEMPESLYIRESFSFKDAINEIGFDETGFHEFAKSIYYVITGNGINSQLRIICDCSEETIARYMYVIYSLLPVNLRKTISFTTYQTQLSTQKSILFERSIKEKRSAYIDVSRNSNNILTLDIDDELSAKYKFIDQAAAFCWKYGNCDDFLSSIEHQMELFGIGDNTDLYMYRVAYNYLRFSDNRDGVHKPVVLNNRLSELLRIPSKNDYVDEQILCVLSKIIDGNVEMKDKLVKRIIKRVTKTKNVQLKELGKQFICKTILTMNKEEAAVYLNEIYPDKNSIEYQGVVDILCTTPEGQEIIDCMWLMAIKTVPATKEGVITFYEDTIEVKNREVIGRALKELMKRYIGRLSKEFNVPNSFMTTIKDIDDLAEQVGITQYKAELKDTVIKKFWDNFKFSYVNKLVDVLAIPPDCFIDSHPKCIVIDRLAPLLETFRYCQFQNLEKGLNDLLEVLNDEDKKQLSVLILDECVSLSKSGTMKDPFFIDGWFMIFEKLYNPDINPAEYMIRNNVKQFTETSLSIILEKNSSIYLSKPDFTRKVIGWLDTCDVENYDTDVSVDELKKILQDSIKPQRGIFGIRKK